MYKYIYIYIYITIFSITIIFIVIIINIDITIIVITIIIVVIIIIMELDPKKTILTMALGHLGPIIVAYMDLLFCFFFWGDVALKEAKTLKPKP